MKNLSRYTYLLCELEASLLMRGIQIGKISKLGWLSGLVKHVILANSLYSLYLLLLSIFQNPSIIPVFTMVLFIDMLG
jgi:hypothetical protein